MPLKAGTFGYRLRRARMAADLSCAALADRLCVSQSTVTRYETGEIVPPPARVAALAAALGVDVAKLTGRP